MNLLSKKIDEALHPVYKQRVPVVALRALNIGVSILPPILIGVLVDNLVPNVSDFAMELIAIIAGILVLNFVLDWAQDYFWHKMEYTGTGLVRTYIFSNAIRKNYSFLHEHSVGEIESKVIHDAEIYTHSKISSIPMLALNIMHIVIILSISFFLSMHIALSVVAFAAVFFVLYKFINKKLRAAALVERESYTNMMVSASEMLSGVNTIQLYGEEKYFTRRFGKVVDRYEHFLVSLRKWNGLAHSSTNKIVGILPLVAAFIGLGLYAAGGITIGEIVIFFSLLPHLAEPIKSLTEFNIDLQNARVVEDRLEELLVAEKPVDDSLVQIDKIHSLEFVNLCFKYENGTEALWDVSFEVKAGDALAVVGRSGTGKSTFLRILKRQLEPSWGDIRVNGIHHRKIDEKSYINRIAVLTQDVFIFDASVRDNIKFGKELSDDNLSKMTKLSALGKIKLDKNAKELAAGERQRLGLARALACEYDILILDEPTGELDADTEAEIIENLKQIQNDSGYTFIIITHSKNVAEKFTDNILELVKRKRKK
ncbi:MAG: ABC transporter ATP-binding protein/permease [Clostridiales bacterium]|jgi:ABC-type bacteriocin/lantibiotic exporter with double-glycine peptidase domain|nr:ABC transporter ATP-binding protein/permease [Clostridiales bacterium]